MQEAFVAALLASARREDEEGEDAVEVMGPARTEDMDDGWVGVMSVGEEEEDNDDDGLDGVVRWVEIKKQIEILREGMDEEK